MTSRIAANAGVEAADVANAGPSQIDLDWEWVAGRSARVALHHDRGVDCCRPERRVELKDTAREYCDTPCIHQNLISAEVTSVETDNERLRIERIDRREARPIAYRDK